MRQGRPVRQLVDAKSFPVTVKTILSLNIRSFSRRLHAAAVVFSSVRNLSNGSWYGMFQNLWDLMTSLSRGLQYLSNASNTLSGLSLSPSSVQIKVLYTSRTQGPPQFKMIAVCTLPSFSETPETLQYTPTCRFLHLKSRTYFPNLHLVGKEI